MNLGCVVRRPGPDLTDFVAVGENSLDTIGVVPPGWAVGAKQPLVRFLELPGGQAATAAVACARLGWRTEYVGAVGDDAAAKVVRAALGREGVELVVATRHGVPTRRALILVDGATGDRTVFEWRDAALATHADEFNEEIFARARVLLVDASDTGLALRAVRTARAAGGRTLVDVDRAGTDVEALLQETDVVILPEAAARAFGAGTELGTRLAGIGHDTGAAAVIATLGSDGALVWCRSGELHVPGYRVNAVDTTGAGDAFRAGFAAAWLGCAGTDPDLAALVADANFVGALSCRAVGAQAGLPSRAEVPGRLAGPV